MTDERSGVPLLAGLAVGAAIGLLAGLTGTGGGIFLTPLLVLAAWTGTRDAAGLSGAFILVNSVAGLAGLLTGGVGPAAGDSALGGSGCRRWPGRLMAGSRTLQHSQPAARAGIRPGSCSRKARVPPLIRGVGWDG